MSNIKNFFKEYKVYIITAVVGVFCAYVVSLFLGYAVVNGESMMPTYHDGEMLWLEKVSDEYERGEVVIVDEGKMLGGDSYYLIKRVIAVEGDVIRFDTETSTLYINNEPQNEGYIAESVFDMGSGAERFTSGYTVPEGQLFVMGDNRNYSYDSRELGCIPVEYVYGVPFDQRG